MSTEIKGPSDGPKVPNALLTRREFLRGATVLAAATLVSTASSKVEASPPSGAIAKPLPPKSASPSTEVEKTRTRKSPTDILFDDPTVFIRAQEKAAAAYAAGVETRPYKVYIPEFFQTAEIEAHSQWTPIGPEVIVLPGMEKDGIRAAKVTADGTYLAGTWHNGLFAGERDKSGKVNWRNISTDYSTGVNRHILTPDFRQIKLTRSNIKSLIICDRGVQILEGGGKGDLALKTFNFPDKVWNVLDFAQTGCLLPDGSLLLGGLGGICKVRGWENDPATWKVETLLSEPGGDNNEPIMIRTIVVDPHDPRKIKAGGWWGYSGQEDDAKGGPLPGAGVLVSDRAGEQGSWGRDKAFPANVNCLFVHPENPSIVIAGREGFGHEGDREPHPDDPRGDSLSISFNGGRNFVSFNPPENIWKYDLIAPQQAFAFDEKTHTLYISCWGGPVWQVFLPPGATKETLDKIMPTFKSLTPPPKEKYSAGHLMLERGDEDQLKVTTGSFGYWKRPIEEIDPFTQLSQREIREGVILH